MTWAAGTGMMKKIVQATLKMVLLALGTHVKVGASGLAAGTTLTSLRVALTATVSGTTAAGVVKPVAGPLIIKLVARVMAAYGAVLAGAKSLDVGTMALRQPVIITLSARGTMKGVGVIELVVGHLVQKHCVISTTQLLIARGTAGTVTRMAAGTMATIQPVIQGGAPGLVLDLATRETAGTMIPMQRVPLMITAYGKHIVMGMVPKTAGSIMTTRQHVPTIAASGKATVTRRVAGVTQPGQNAAATQTALRVIIAAGNPGATVTRLAAGTTITRLGAWPRPDVYGRLMVKTDGATRRAAGTTTMRLHAVNRAQGAALGTMKAGIVTRRAAGTMPRKHSAI